VRVRVGEVKSNGSAKYVELSVEDLWTRVRFPPPPPNTKATLAVAFAFGVRRRESNLRDAGRTGNSSRMRRAGERLCACKRKGCL